MIKKAAGGAETEAQAASRHKAGTSPNALPCLGCVHASAFTETQPKPRRRMEVNGGVDGVRRRATCGNRPTTASK